MKQHPLAAKSTELGRIEVVEYTGTRHLFIPATAGLPAPSKGETLAMLVHTNKDADILLGLLRGLGLPTASFANHDDFRIWQLQAMRAFCELLGPTDNAFIDSGRWEAAKQELRLQVPDSEDRRLAERVIGLFEEQYSPMPASEWPIFLKEIKVEDLGIKSDEKIFVSTLHRAKGLEFDRVVLLLNQPYGSDEALRLLYVGLTRAKKRLDIHVTHAFFAPFAGRIPGLSYRIDAAPYRHPKRVALSMGLADAWLNFFKHPGTKATLGGLRVHEALFLSADGTYLQTAEGRAAVAFSKIFQEKIQQWRERGYWFSRAAVLHLVYWYDKMSQQEVLVALAQVELEREDG
jgi:ATP-dependent DNA helicase RecQ